jgi:valyl-tRNA synthetase
MKELDKKYKSPAIEKKWQENWERENIYRWDDSQTRENTYVIDTPPPTVSGMLHMGHVFSYVQADFIARYQRMKGKTVYYPMGFDDNGLPTERLVEKIKKVKGSQLPRDEFIELCKEVTHQAKNDFRDLFKSIALSVDWQEEYHTISDHTRAISQMSFLDLYQKELIEHKYEPCYFDVTDQTSLAQADLEDKELDSSMDEIHFSLENSAQKITIATTRAELIPACVAIFAHPDDKRYKKLIGQNALTALFAVKVPIIADRNVDPEKGTGLVMCCSFGDMTDVLWWKQHKLDSHIILNKYGKIKNFLNSQSSEYDEVLCDLLAKKCDLELYKKHYNNLIGKKTTSARIEIVTELKKHKLIIKQTPIKHAVKCAERSGTPIEILLTKQWFIKILDHKENFAKQVEKSKWHPPYMKNRIDQWINGLSYDWCISRQRFFGVPFPLWFVTSIKTNLTEVVIADKAELPIDPLKSLPQGYILTKNIAVGEFIAQKDGREYHIKGETDVMDTWATSSVSPQISSSAINKEYAVNIEKHQKLFPADLRPQAHEIIRSWAFYSFVKAYFHEKTIPWHNLMISGWCLASDKTKMSKSKGNVVTPVKLIEEKGSDIVRYWAATSHLGTDTAYSEDVLSIGKKLTNKLWNATKFCQLHLQNIELNQDSALANINNKTIYCVSDLWLLSHLYNTIKKSSLALEQYQYAKAKEYIEDFFWNYFCDNYLELVKARIYGDLDNLRTYNSQLDIETVNKRKISAIYTIYHSLEVILKLFAPFMPHITEELYSSIYVDKPSIHSRASWPQLDEFAIAKQAQQSGDVIIDIINLVRKDKSNQNFSLKKEISLLEINLPHNINDFLSDLIDDLAAICNAKNIKLSDKATAINIKLIF